MIQQYQTPQAPPTIINAGFESNPLDGWKTVGVVESGGYDSEKRLTHPGGNAPVESIQKLSHISSGWYTLKVWVKSTGKQKEAYIGLKDCGEDAKASVPILREKWLQVGELILLKSNNPSVYTALRVDKNGIFLILANLSDEAITKYGISLKDAGLAESVYGVETLFGAGQANGPERSGEAFPEYKPFEKLDPYAMYVIKLQSAAAANPK